METACYHAGMLEQLTLIIKTVAQEVILPRYLKVSRGRKQDGSLFTEADLAMQDALTTALNSFCDCPLLGEEMSSATQRELWASSREGLWCVDPIDGTTNFVNGIPYFAVSVALIREGRPLFGVVYDPVADEAFSAARGQGAYLNGRPLPLSDTVESLQDAVASVDLKRLPAPLARTLATTPPYASQRNFGACTLEWCYVAAGRFNAYLHGGQKLWDFAAGSLILEEAGGQCCTLDGLPFWDAPPWQRSVIAALNPALFEEWRTWLQRCG